MVFKGRAEMCPKGMLLSATLKASISVGNLSVFRCVIKFAFENKITINSLLQYVICKSIKIVQKRTESQGVVSTCNINRVIY